MKLRLSRFPWAVVVPALLLIGIGLLGISSSDPHGGLTRDQLKWLGIGSVGFLFTALFPYRLLERLSYPLYALHIVLILAVAVGGVVRNHSKRWLDLQFMMFQPSLTMKLALVMAVASCIACSRKLKRPQGLMLPLVLAGFPAALVKLQPDLGTALTYLPVPLVLLFAGGARKRHLAGLFAIALACAPLLWFFAMDNYQQDRVKALLFPDDMRQTTAYQTTHALYAFAGGGLKGLGYGEGAQTHLGWLPEPHTDFIFAVIGEEWGLWGAGLVLLLFGLMLLALLEVAANTRDPFGRLLVLGIGTVLAVHIVQNCGMNLGLLPVTGLTLPFVSYGGSSLVNMLAGLGLIVNVALRPMPVFASDISQDQ